MRVDLYGGYILSVDVKCRSESDLIYTSQNQYRRNLTDVIEFTAVSCSLNLPLNKKNSIVISVIAKGILFDPSPPQYHKPPIRLGGRRWTTVVCGFAALIMNSGRRFCHYPPSCDIFFASPNILYLHTFWVPQWVPSNFHDSAVVRYSCHPLELRRTNCPTFRGFDLNLFLNCWTISTSQWRVAEYGGRELGVVGLPLGFVTDFYMDCQLGFSKVVRTWFQRASTLWLDGSPCCDWTRWTVSTAANLWESFQSRIFSSGGFWHTSRSLPPVRSIAGYI